MQPKEEGCLGRLAQKKEGTVTERDAGKPGRSGGPGMVCVHDWKKKKSAREKHPREEDSDEEGGPS